MPELPEVETIKKQLTEKIIGKKISQVEKLHPKTLEGKESDILGAKIRKLWRRAKILVFDLDNKKSLVLHLKLTGQLIFEEKGQRAAGGHPIPPLNSPLPNKSTRVIFHFSDGSKLYFNDIRLFGYIKIVKTADVVNLKVFQEFGPEPFFKEFTKKWLKEALSIRSTKIKVLLMDQNFISGVGNIYSDEALYCARIHPFRQGNKLSGKEIETLYECLKKVLKLGIKYGGASDNAYVNAKGEQGKYMLVAKVYHCTGKKCQRDGAVIVKKKIGGRSTHFCPKCQK